MGGMNVPTRIGGAVLAAGAAGAALGFGLPHPAATAQAGAAAFATPPATVHASPPPSPPVVVYVAGDVVRPGVYRLRSGLRVVDALHAAGDAKPDADLVAVNLAGPLRDGDEIAVPAKGERPPAGRRPRAAGGAARAGAGTHGRRGRKRNVPPAAPIDLNAADAATLAALPGIGAGLAARIVAFRTANGPFASIDALADVAGITDRRLEEIVPYLIVRP